ncbi:MAG: pyruvate dehydrogenase (acetyl-transferring) E1 component subunit alpha [Opitutaceae bacterium]|nr:pyruvate dehydrogenase (acetyl-transferring) E1 component subunit alpha [Opitutaceae bacterium]
MSKKPAAIVEKKEAPPAVRASASSRAPINARLSTAERIALYRTMMRIRRFEERSLRAYQQGRIGGFLHLYIGQEAVAVGCCSVMQKDDHVITAYRDHGHAIAVGMNLNELMAELYGKASGCSKGKGGSMHFFDPARNYWGGHGIVGGQLPLGTGIAYALKYRGLKGACLTFMGDGAVNQGAVHEAYNLAALWSLPVVFVIENNGYSMGTSQRRSSAGPGLAQRAEGYGMAWDTGNGHDLYEVREKTDRMLQLAREKFQPGVLEIMTYRYRGHSVADPDSTYRTKEEIENYRRTKDPLTLTRDMLAAEGVLTAEVEQEVDAAARAEAERAAEFAEASPFPAVGDIRKDVYWEEDNPGQKQSQGRIFFD